jgi:membrane-anchored glycerophosphoryl diester phosphodiesterase (GDPDase)
MALIKKNTTRRRYLSSLRFWLAGPVTVVVSVLIMAAMSLWLPEGNAHIDHLIVPVILFPLIWSAVFFYVILANNMKKVSLIMALLFLSNGLVVTASILGWL